MLVEHAYPSEHDALLRSSSSSPADLNFYHGHGSSASPPLSASPPSPRPPVSEVTYSHLMRGPIVSVPKSWQAADNGERLVLNVYSFLRTLLGASGSSQGAIDNRIEQAMDLVKSHLMTAVRSEVEELKEKIIRLEDTISHLQTENDFLRAHVPNEVLAQLHQYTSLAHLAMLQPQQQQQQQHVVMMPPQPGSSPTGLSSSAPQK